MNMIDEVDLEILRMLQDNAKTTTKQISNKLCMSQSPVYERIKRLERKGYIKKYVALLDKKKLSKHVSAICMVSLRYHNEGFIDSFDKQVRELKEVQECYHMAGKVDFFLKIHLETLEEYHEFVRSKLSRLKNIGVLESYFILKEVRNTTEFDI